MESHYLKLETLAKNRKPDFVQISSKSIIKRYNSFKALSKRVYSGLEKYGAAAGAAIRN